MPRRGGAEPPRGSTPRGSSRRPASRRRRRLRLVRRVLVVSGLLVLVALAGVGVLISTIELPEDDFDDLVQTSYVCTAEVAEGCGPEVATAQLAAGEDREVVPYDAMPQVLIEAVVATEDQEFFSHQGVDPLGIARALYRDVRGDAVQQGGSTITQQYVKNAFLTPERSLSRKVREAVLAVKLERELTKEEILARYLNRIYFGRGAYGVAAASRAYFAKPLDQLDLADAAYLAGLIRAPESADAERHPEEASRRRRSVLRQMVDEGYITEAQAAEADARPWTDLRPRQRREGLGEVRGREYGTEYFVEAVRRQVGELFPDGEVYTQGLRIYTTLDHERQRAAYESVVEVVDPADADNPDASIVALDGGGGVVAMVGGTDFASSQVNLALGRQGGGSGRQPGSAFKTFALAEAIEQGYSGRSLYRAPSRIVLEDADGGADWRVSGGGSPNGYRDLVDALRVSSNTVYAQLMVDLGPESVVELARRVGVTADLAPVPSLVLGAGEVSVLDMAASYSTFANEGVRRPPRLIQRIEDSDGEVVCWYPTEGRCVPSGEPPSEQVLDPAIARQVNHAMQQVVRNGTGRRAAFGRDAAGKTGTTQDNRDAWFVGFTCDLTAAVWMGYAGAPGEPPRFMDDVQGGPVQGGGLPAELFSRFMRRATEAAPPCSLPTQDEFPGVVQNRSLSTTTTLAPSTTSTTEATTTTEGTDPSTTDPAGASSTTLPPSTTEPDPATTQAPGGGATTTTTTQPGGGGAGGGSAPPA